MPYKQLLLTYMQKLASLFPDKPLDRIIEVLKAGVSPIC